MRIAMLQSTLPPSQAAGGVGYQVHLLSNELSRRGHDVVVFAAEGSPDGARYRVEHVASGRSRVAAVVTVGYRFARLPLAGFDIVHAHGDDWLFGRRPRVRTFYGSALMEARTATSATRAGAQLAYYGLEWVSSLNRSSVSISSRTHRYLPLVKATVPCAYDPATFHAGGERTSSPSVLFVAGTLQGRKRGDLLIGAFAEVRAARPDARLTIVSRDTVVGPGITCFSGVDARTLGELYRSHWLLCSTSSYEGFGVPYIEAMASGLPVVTTANDGAAEVLDGGRLGTICAPAELAQGILTLLEDGGRREELAVRGIKAARQYSLSVVTDTYQGLYERLLAGPARGARPTGTTSADSR